MVQTDLQIPHILFLELVESEAVDTEVPWLIEDLEASLSSNLWGLEEGAPK